MYNKMLLFVLAILCSNGTFALSTDREQPIQIEADKATIDNIKGIAIYEGNVIISQGSIQINAETMTINYSKSHDIEKAVATGKPARFQQRLDSGEDIKAKAKEMEYNALRNMLHLKIDAELRKGKNGKDNYISHAPRISYDTQRAIITADVYQGKSKNNRVRMTFNPTSNPK
jgi:lipopolysaccharide export system protein LptA